MDSVKGLFDALDNKYNSASGPWKWAIGILILLVALALIGYYVYKWLIFTVEQDEQALRKTFGVLSMRFDTPELKEAAKPYRKANNLVGSDPETLQAFGRAWVGGPGRHWRFFGAHGFIVIKVRPRNFHFPLYIQRDPGNRYNAFIAHVTVVVAIRDILRWHMANNAVEELLGQILEDGFRQVAGDRNYGPKMFDISADRHKLMRVLADKTHSECARLGVEVDNLFMGMPEERTETMMPEVIKDKDFFQGLLDFMRGTIFVNTNEDGQIVINMEPQVISAA